MGSRNHLGSSPQERGVPRYSPYYRMESSAHNSRQPEQSAGGEVSPLVVECVRYLEKTGGIDTLGIFRKSANTAEVEKLKRQFDAEGHVDLDNVPDPHVVAALLKLYLKELPESVVPSTLYNKLFAEQQTSDRLSKLSSLRNALNQLPPSNYQLVAFVIGFLSRVGEHSEVNKMRGKDLAAVFGPILLRPRKERVVEDSQASLWLVDTFIAEVSELFHSSAMELPPPQSLTKKSSWGEDKTAPMALEMQSLQGGSATSLDNLGSPRMSARSVGSTFEAGNRKSLFWKGVMCLTCTLFVVFVVFTVVIFQMVRHGVQRELEESFISNSLTIKSPSDEVAKLVLENEEEKISFVNNGLGRFSVNKASLGERTVMAIAENGRVCFGHDCANDQLNDVDRDTQLDIMGGLRIRREGNYDPEAAAVTFPDGTKMTTAAKLSVGHKAEADLTLAAETGSIMMVINGTERLRLNREGELVLGTDHLRGSHEEGLAITTTKGDIVLAPESNVKIPPGTQIHVENNLVLDASGIKSQDGSIRLNPNSGKVLLGDDSYDFFLSRGTSATGPGKSTYVEGQTASSVKGGDVVIRGGEGITVNNPPPPVGAHSSGMMVDNEGTETAGGDVYIDGGKGSSEGSVIIGSSSSLVTISKPSSLTTMYGSFKVLGHAHFDGGVTVTGSLLVESFHEETVAASESNSGIVTTGEQTFGGHKTFVDQVTISSFGPGTAVASQDTAGIVTAEDQEFSGDKIFYGTTTIETFSSATQSASDTQPGIVTTDEQAFSGHKKFIDPVTITSFHPSTVAASASQAGIVTTGSQTFAGEKTFADRVTMSGTTVISTSLVFGDTEQPFAVTRPAVQGNATSTTIQGQTSTDGIGGDLILDAGLGGSGEGAGVGTLCIGCSSGRVVFGKTNSTTEVRGDLTVDGGLSVSGKLVVEGVTKILSFDPLTAPASTTEAGIVTTGDQSFSGHKTFVGQTTISAFSTDSAMATETHPGLVSTSEQSFAGTKTFLGVTTIQKFGEGSQMATVDNPGLVSTGEQEFAGDKTFVGVTNIANFGNRTAVASTDTWGLVSTSDQSFGGLKTFTEGLKVSTSGAFDAPHISISSADGVSKVDIRGNNTASVSLGVTSGEEGSPLSSVSMAMDTDSGLFSIKDTTDGSNLLSIRPSTGAIGIGRGTTAPESGSGVAVDVTVAHDTETGERQSSLHVASLPTGSVTSFLSLRDVRPNLTADDAALGHAFWLVDMEGATDSSSASRTVGGITNSPSYNSVGLDGNRALYLVAPVEGNAETWEANVVVTADSAVGIGVLEPEAQLHVEGDLLVTGSLHATNVSYTSDARLKTNILPLQDVLSKVMSLRAVRYNWKQSAASELGFQSNDRGAYDPAVSEIGLLAQELEQVFPELVGESNRGFKGIDYARLSSVLLEAVKDVYSQLSDMRVKVDRFINGTHRTSTSGGSVGVVGGGGSFVDASDRINSTTHAADHGLDHGHNVFGSAHKDINAQVSDLTERVRKAELANEVLRKKLAILEQQQSAPCLLGSSVTEVAAAALVGLVLALAFGRRHGARRASVGVTNENDSTSVDTNARPK